MKQIIKSLLVAIVAIIATLPTSAQEYGQFGFAALGGKTTGSGNANPVIVTTYEDLKRALKKNDSIPTTIYLKGEINIPRAIKVSKVANKTIYGLPGSALVNNKHTIVSDSTGILTLDGCYNFIIRNVTFKGPGAFDRDAKDNLNVLRTTRLWVDHCDFQDGQDGNFDCAKGSDFITVSWCRFRYLIAPWPVEKDDTNEDHTDDHRFSNLWGSSDKDSITDEGHLNTTFYACWWDEGCRNRMPFARYGRIHILNCLYSSEVASTCLNVRFRSNFYVENCAFTTKNAKKKAWKAIDPTKENNTFHLTITGCAGTPDGQWGQGEDYPFFYPNEYYQYKAMPATMVPFTIGDNETGAGATLEIGEPKL